MTTNVFNLKSYLNLNLFQLITANRFIGKDNIDHIMFAGFWRAALFGIKMILALFSGKDFAVFGYAQSFWKCF